MKVLGVIPVYNDEDCVANAILNLVGVCDEVHVFDHGSTDGTANAVDAMTGPVFRREVDREEYPPTDAVGVQSFALWRMIAGFVRDAADEFEWVVWSDADEILRPPSGGLLEWGAIEWLERNEYDVVRPLIRTFRMTKADPPDEANYLQRMKFFDVNRKGHSPRVWKCRLTPEDLPAGAHVQDPASGPKAWPHYALWPEGTKVYDHSNGRLPWLLDHYPFRDVTQAWNKIRYHRDWLMPTPGHKRKYGRYIVDGANPQGFVRTSTRQLNRDNDGRRMP